MNEENGSCFENRTHAEPPRVTPLLYGLLGLWRRTGEPIFADDIDVLLPETWLPEQWSAFQTPAASGGLAPD